MIAMKEYILSVDGGNTKTDYLLTTTKGEYVAIGRYGTCSHEQFKTGFVGMYEAMKSHFEDFFSKNNISSKDILYATFGLAGCDVPSQHKSLCEKISLLGFSDFEVSNDALLGLFALSESCVGVSSVCGTGTVTLGIDSKGKTLQVGGIGAMSRDLAGGAFLYREVIASVYEYYFKNGRETILSSMLEEILEYTDKYKMPELINDGKKIFDNQVKIIKALDEAVIKKDDVAVEIMEKMAQNLANSVVGCVRELSFESDIDIVMIGSLWSKLKNEVLINTYKKVIVTSISNNCRFMILNTPPVVGGIFNSINKSKVSCDSGYKNRLTDFLTVEKYEEIIGF